MRMITLMKIDSDPVAQGALQDGFSETDDVTEAALQAERAGAAGAAGAYRPVAINADAIRCFYTRNDSKPGTRVTFIDGGGFAVSETYDEVLSKVQPN